MRPIAALPVDRGDGHRRVVEEAGEAHLGGAQRLRAVLAGRAVEDERARRHRGAPSARDRRRGGEAAPAGAAPFRLTQVEVDRLGAVVAALAAHAGKQRALSPRTMSRERQRPRLELGEVDAEPFGERRVEVDDAPAGSAEKKPAGAWSR